jgi:IS5 family transposase
MRGCAESRSFLAGLNICGPQLIVNVCATAATGTAERETAVIMVAAGGRRRRTLGGDKNYDVASCVEALRDLGVTPHVAQKVQFTAIDGRTTRQPGYAVSQRKRKLVEQAFGWMKTIGLLRKLRHRGGELVDWNMTFTAAAYNLIRLRTLLARA